jgi:amino-acid N-acetyltransferase
MSYGLDNYITAWNSMKFVISRAAYSDIDDIYSILNPYSNDGVILDRPKEDIEKNIDKFFIAKIKNNIAGVVSYYNYSDELMEIRSLAVKKEYYNLGIGAVLVKTIVKKLLKDYKNVKIFALSYVPDFFKKAGFTEVLRDSLPEKIWKDCQNCDHQFDCGETALVYLKK